MVMNLPASVAVLNEPMTMSLVPRGKHHAIELESSVVSLLLMINGIFPQVNETSDAHNATKTRNGKNLSRCLLAAI
jgi:hypothetical protein